MPARTIRLAIVATLLSAVVIGALAPTATAAGIPDYRFGVVEAFAAPSAAAALGAGWGRVTFEWSRIQPSGPDEWNGPISDQALATEFAHGRQVIGLLITIPAWAIETENGRSIPRGLYLPADDPNNLWAGFVHTMVTRYAGRIDHWIIWNEPDIPAGAPDASWLGSIEDYLQLLRVAYFVAKDANPNAVIHLASIMHYYDPGWYNRFLDTLVADPNAAANNFYFDVAGFNLYLQPEVIYDIASHYRQMLYGKGVHKPFWITETNAYLSRVSPEEQAMFMVQAFSLQIAAGAQRIGVYKMIDVATDLAADPEPFGLVQGDGVRRPAFTAYQVAATHLAGFRGATWDRRDEVSVVTVDRGPRTTTVVWARTPEPQLAMVPARATRALAVNIWGSAYHVYPERGYYFIELAGANCTQGCVMGGPPMMLIEDAPVNADTAPVPASPTPPLPPAGGSDASATPGSSPAASARPTTVAAQAATPTTTPTPSPSPTQTPTHMPCPELPSPTPTATPTATATPSSTPTSTPTLMPTDTPTARPTPTPRPVPVLEIAPGGGWSLGVLLACAAGGTALAVSLRKQTAPDTEEHESAQPRQTR